MNYFIYLLSFFLSLGQLERISFLDQHVNIYLHEVILLLIIIFYILTVILIKKTKLGKKLTTIEKAIVIFLSILLLSFINGFSQFTFSQNIVGFLYFGRVCMYFLFFFALTHWNSQNNEQSQKMIRKGIIIFATLTIIFSYLQYFLYPNLRNLSYLGWDSHYYRVFGLFFDTSTAGMIYLLLYLWLDNQNMRCKGVVKTSILILILLTYSRITYVTFLLSQLYSFIFHQFSQKKLVIIILFFMGIFLIPRPAGEGGKLSRTYTISARINNYKEGLLLWAKRPFLGYGYNRLRYIRGEKNMNHDGASFSSSYLTILVSSGVMGLLGLLFLFYSLFRHASRKGKILIFVIAFSSLFDNIFLNNFVMTIFFILFTII